MEYVIGNEYHQSRTIMDRLGIDLSKAVSLQDYKAGKEQIPILVCSGGRFHNDTLTLSNKLKSAQVPVDIKVIFDRHADFNHEAKEQNDSDYCSHALTIYKEGFLESLHILGIEEDSQVPQIQKALGRHGSLESAITGIWSPTNLKYSADINKAREIKGKNIHISVDIDVIPNLDCVGITWGGKIGPSVREVSDTLRWLVINNNLTAFDIVGYYPQDLADSSVTNPQGILVYKQLIDQVVKTL